MKQGTISITPGRLTAAYEKAVRRATKVDLVGQIMQRKPGVFSSKPAIKKLIANRLGWVDSATLMKRRVNSIEQFGNEVLKSGIKDVVLIGMGGSSLCPDLFRLICKRHPKLKSFNVIDSTDPAAVTTLARKLEAKKTLFIIASKSGGTVETRSHEAFFIGWLKDNGVKMIGRHMVAITDSGSALHKFARKNKYRKVFLNRADIGGRYSSLSYFGMVPAFFAGVDVRALIDDAVQMQKLLVGREGETNPALVLGSILAAGAKVGCDKLTFIASKKTAPLVPWVEQLVGESTGKKKKGVIPIEAEPVGKIEQYKDDRLFVFLKMTAEKTPADDKLKQALIKKRFGVIDITLGSVAELGRQFLVWQTATAVAGYHLAINPFDEPNVTESKNNTNTILAAFERAGEFPQHRIESRWGKIALVAYGGDKKYTRAERQNLSRLLKRFMTGARRPSYLAALNYFKSDNKTEAALGKLRKTVRDKTGMATLRGYGPRYLHSVGQLYKGGPQTGLFVLIVKAKYGRLPIPGRHFDFGELIASQAIGDAQALIKRGLPTLVFAIEGSTTAGLESLARAFGRALK
jgi:glucose-6-phosphate isomerase